MINFQFDPANIFLSSYLIGLSGALMPGPLLTVCIAQTARYGFRQAPLITLGHGILEAVVVFAAAVLGGAAFFQTDGFLGAVFLLGGGVLFYLGQDMIRHAWKIPLFSPENGKEGVRSRSGVAAGMIATGTNAAWIWWWAAIGVPLVFISGGQGIRGVTAFYTGHIMADVSWYFLVGATVAFGRRFFSEGFYHGLIAVCGGMLIAFSLLFLWNGYGKWF